MENIAQVLNLQPDEIMKSTQYTDHTIKTYQYKDNAYILISLALILIWQTKNPHNFSHIFVQYNTFSDHTENMAHNTLLWLEKLLYSFVWKLK